MKKELTLEQAMGRLDEIVAALEDGGLPLDDALKLYEEGAGLMRLCSGKLEGAQLKVEALSREMEQGEKPQEEQT